MTDFTLDTSGSVTIPGGPYAGVWTWERIGQERGPFAQGFIEAAWEAVRELRRDAEDRVQMNLDDLGYRHLSPSALALILRVTEAMAAIHLARVDGLTIHDGPEAWRMLQSGALIAHGWRPVVITLSDKGQVEVVPLP